MSLVSHEPTSLENASSDFRDDVFHASLFFRFPFGRKEVFFFFFFFFFFFLVRLDGRQERDDRISSFLSSLSCAFLRVALPVPRETVV